MNVLRRGGSAVDAAIAVQAMLSLVEPQSSGLGGGAFLHYYDAGSRSLTVYDGREIAPAGATPDMFLDDSGAPLPFGQAVLSGRATGVPGAVAHASAGPSRARPAGLEHACSPTPSAPRATASSSRRVSPGWSPAARRRIRRPDVRAYFSKPDGTLVRAGDRLRNPGLCRIPAAASPRRAPTPSTAVRPRRGSSSGHATGALAGTMTLDDLAGYRPVEAGIALPHLAGSPALRAAAAVERRRAASADADPRADRHRRARAGRSAGLVPVRRGEPAHVRRPRPLCRRSGLRPGPGRRPARSGLCRRARRG